MNELTFLDLVILRKIDANSSVENFGSSINTSFFETANLLGTLKIKGYVNIEPSVGGISKVIVTDAGTGILALADKKASEPSEPLDSALLHALAGGAKTPEALQSQLNIRSGDLACHIHKLVSQGLMDFDVRSAKVSLMLTEQGFNSTGGVKVQGAPPIAQKAPTAAETGEGKERARVKEDIMHILRGVETEKKPRHGQAHDHDKQGMPKPPLSPDEEKRLEKSRRLASKMRHYAAEYWMWLLLLIIAMAIFASAVHSMVSRIYG